MTDQSILSGQEKNKQIHISKIFHSIIEIYTIFIVIFYTF